MKPENTSYTILATARARAKMFEYHVPAQDFIHIPRDPAQLFSLAIGMLGDVAASILTNRSGTHSFGEMKSNLIFCARFFDSYREAQLDNELNPYVLLLASSSYYLAELPGSAQVTASQLPEPFPDLSSRGLEQLLSWVMRANYRIGPVIPTSTFNGLFEVTELVMQFFSLGTGKDELLRTIQNIRTNAYHYGTARELLLADLIGAIIQVRHANSTWSTLPKYSNLSHQVWSPVLEKQAFIRELWPAQRLLGEQGIFQGESAVVQMPTSAGKTKALDLIIRGAFYSGRTALVVVVAPFRALCEEIRQTLSIAFSGEFISVDVLTDVQQPDFEPDKYLSSKQILVMTPEKCLYLLRQNGAIAEQLGLLIYDEGHQFDNGRRGVTYELLLTSLKNVVSRNTQTVLISAVLNNAQAIADWLIGNEAKVVAGSNLLPTTRALAFVSWIDTLGRLEFTDPTDPDINEFYVPRIIEQQTLNNFSRERKPRVFPEKTSTSIGLYLALKMARSGGVAVFTGTKITASSLIAKSVEAYERKLEITPPIAFSDTAEVMKLTYQNQANLGLEAASTKAARLGIYSHHGNTPHGIRLAIEHAMKEGLIRLVICTSTLAQGVNLPIRYLIVTGTNLGREVIKTRDFHNLLGRAGRAGMYTEGTVIFSDPTIYDERFSDRKQRKWTATKSMLDASNSEDCTSSLLSVLDPLQSDNGQLIYPVNDAEVLAAHAKGPDELQRLANRLAKGLEIMSLGIVNFSEGSLQKQLTEKSSILSAIESFLMAHWKDDSDSPNDTIESLTASTFAYHLATLEQRFRLRDLFASLASNIVQSVPKADERRIYSRTLFGLRDCNYIRDWVGKNEERLLDRTDTIELLNDLWPLFTRFIRSKVFVECFPFGPMSVLTESWIAGDAFDDLLNILVSGGCRIGARKPLIEHTVEICESVLGYDGMLIVGAVAEMLAISHTEQNAAVKLLRQLQKQIKYGLSSGFAISLFELGFADRVIAQHLAAALQGLPSQSWVASETIVQMLKERQEIVRNVLEAYPSYFSGVLDNLLSTSN